MEVRKDRANEQEQVHILGSGGGQEAAKGNSIAFKKVVMEKEPFDGWWGGKRVLTLYIKGVN